MPDLSITIKGDSSQIEQSLKSVTDGLKSLQTALQQTGRASDTTSQSLDRTGQSMKALSFEIARVGGGLRAAGQEMRTFGLALTAAFAGVAGAMGLVAKTGVDMNVRLEQAGLFFTRLTGSAQQATQFIGQLRDAVHSMGMVFGTEALPAAQMLAAAFGPQGLNHVIPALRAFGDVRFSVGADAERQAAAMRAFSQMVTSDRPDQRFLREMQRDLPGFNPEQIIQQKFGTTDTKTLEKMHKTGQDIALALIQGMQEQFGGTQDILAKQLPIQLSDLKEDFQQLSAAITQAFSGSVTDSVRNFVASFDQLLKNKSALDALSTPFTLIGLAIGGAVSAITALIGAFTRLNPGAQQLIVLAGALAVAFAGLSGVALIIGGTFISFLGSMAQVAAGLVLLAPAVTAVVAALTPFAPMLLLAAADLALVGAAVTALVGGALALWVSEMGGLRNATEATWSAIKFVIDTAVRDAGTVIQTGLDLIQGNWASALLDLHRLWADFWQRLGDPVGAGFNQVLKGVQDGMRKVGGLLSTLHGLEGVPGVGLLPMIGDTLTKDANAIHLPPVTQSFLGHLPGGLFVRPHHGPGALPMVDPRQVRQQDEIARQTRRDLVAAMPDETPEQKHKKALADLDARQKDELEKAKGNEAAIAAIHAKYARERTDADNKYLDEVSRNQQAYLKDQEDRLDAHLQRVKIKLQQAGKDQQAIDREIDREKLSGLMGLMSSTGARLDPRVSRDLEKKILDLQSTVQGESNRLTADQLRNLLRTTGSLGDLSVSNASGPPDKMQRQLAAASRELTLATMPGLSKDDVIQHLERRKRLLEEIAQTQKDLDRDAKEAADKAKRDADDAARKKDEAIRQQEDLARSEYELDRRTAENRSQLLALDQARLKVLTDQIKALGDQAKLTTEQRQQLISLKGEQATVAGNVQTEGAVLPSATAEVQSRITDLGLSPRRRRLEQERDEIARLVEPGARGYNDPMLQGDPDRKAQADRLFSEYEAAFQRFHERWRTLWRDLGEQGSKALGESLQQGLTGVFERLMGGKGSLKDVFKHVLDDLRNEVAKSLSRVATTGIESGLHSLLGSVFGGSRHPASILEHAVGAMPGGNFDSDRAGTQLAKGQVAALPALTGQLREHTARIVASLAGLASVFEGGKNKVAAALAALIDAFNRRQSGGAHHGGILGAIGGLIGGAFGGPLGSAIGGALGSAVTGDFGGAVSSIAGGFADGALGGSSFGAGLDTSDPSNPAVLSAFRHVGPLIIGSGSMGPGLSPLYTPGSMPAMAGASGRVLNVTIHQTNHNVTGQVDMDRANYSLARSLQRTMRTG